MLKELAKKIGLTQLSEGEFINPETGKTIKVVGDTVTITDFFEDKTLGEIAYLMQYVSDYPERTLFHINSSDYNPFEFINYHEDELEYTFLPDNLKDTEGFVQAKVKFIIMDPLMNISMSKDGELGASDFLGNDEIKEGGMVETLVSKTKSVMTRKFKVLDYSKMDIKPIGVYYDGQYIHLIILGSLLDGKVGGKNIDMVPVFAVKPRDETDEMILKGVRSLYVT